MYIFWEQLDGHMFYDPINFFNILRNFRELGFTDDYDACYYDYRVQKRKHEYQKYSAIWWWEYFLDLICGYGVKPFQAIFWAGGIMLLCTLLYIEKTAIELRVERKKCNGVTKNGNSCMNNRKYGTEFCNQHQNQATLFRRFKNTMERSISNSMLHTVK